MTGLFTQCPDCSTVFRVTAETLRAAQGRVRCGICSATFSALDNLSEHPVPRASGGTRDEDTITVEELPATEFIELAGGDGDSGPGDGDGADPAAGHEPAASSDAVPQPDGNDGMDAIPDAALEFHGSVEDLERLFVQAGPPAALPATGQALDADVERAIDEVARGDFSGIEVHESELPEPGADPFSATADPGQIAAVLAFPASQAASQPEAAGHEAPEAPPEAAETAQDEDLDRTDEYPVLVMDEIPDTWAAAGAANAPPLATETPDAPTPGAEGPEAEATGDGTPTAGESPPGVPQQDEAPLLLIPEQLRRDAALSAAEDLVAPAEFGAEAGPRRWPLTLAAALLAAGLVAQAVHHWREDIARHPALGPWLLGAYSALGLDAPAPVDLAAFELRQLGAASEPSQAGRIKVRASIVNRAPFAQPYPILRLTLQDRFGSTIGARELEPAQYLPGGATSASGLLGPSQRADAEVVFVDPGRDAVGFELDVCITGAGGLRCSADLPPVRQ